MKSDRVRHQSLSLRCVTALPNAPYKLNAADRQRLRHLSTTWLQRWHQGTPV